MSITGTETNRDALEDAREYQRANSGVKPHWHERRGTPAESCRCGACLIAAQERAGEFPIQDAPPPSARDTYALARRLGDAPADLPPCRHCGGVRDVDEGGVRYCTECGRE